jgi:hypothetical protein
MVRVRHCVECPKCHTRYLPGFTPYRNGSYLIPLTKGFPAEWTLYCSCGRPHTSTRWSWREFKSYSVTGQAHRRGYGSPEEILDLKPAVARSEVVPFDMADLELERKGRTLR